MERIDRLGRLDYVDKVKKTGLHRRGEEDWIVSVAVPSFHIHPFSLWSPIDFNEAQAAS